MSTWDGGPMTTPVSRLAGQGGTRTPWDPPHEPEWLNDADALQRWQVSVRLCCAQMAEEQ